VRSELIGCPDQTEADAGGYGSARDYDHENAAVNPGAEEIAGNGVDDNCHPG